jgi:two-component system invasion response regulator UvrY
MTRILLVDDHPFIRKGIRETLTEAMSLLEIEEAGDGMEALEMLRARAYDLAIIDVSMPRKDGLELMKDALAFRPGSRFLVMSVYPEREFAERAYRNGASGYIGKSCPPEDFLEAVRRILSGRTYVSPEYAELLVARGSPRDQRGAAASSDSVSPELAELSDRELAVLRLVAEGASLTRIGRELNLSVKTVSTYKSRAMSKLALANNAELIAYALSHGLASPPSA